MNFKVAEEDAKERIEHLLQCIRAFAQENRRIPSRILTELCHLHRHWQNRDDIPPIVVDAYERWDRFTPAKPAAKRGRR